MRRATALTVAALLAGGTACTTGGQAGTTGGPTPVHANWTAIPGPPAAPGGRVMVTALATCPGRLYAVGALVTGSGPAATYRPAAWAGTDAGRTWTALPVRPTGSYGPKQLLTSAACHGDRLVAVGAVAGGAHANLRISTWLGTGGGPLTEVRAPFEQYGGPEQLDTGRVAAGPRGFVIEGNRARQATGPPGTGARTGPAAAVWASTDGAAFTLVDADPALLSTAERSTTATGVAALPDGSWLLVGSGVRPGQAGRRDPLAWHSADGLRWRTVAPPPAAPDESFDRVAVAGGTVVAAGTRGGTFGAWHDGFPVTGRWTPAGLFDRPGGTRPPSVTGLVALGPGQVLATVDNGSAHRLWLGTVPAGSGRAGGGSDRQGRAVDAGRWRELAAPEPVRAGPDRVTAAVTGAGTLLLVVDDGSRTRMWLTAAPAG